MRPGPDNEAGYWENIAIKALDDDLLAHLGGSWDQPPVLAPGWQTDPSLDEFRARAADVLDEAFGSATTTAGPIGWKDPRLSLLLPFWRTVCAIDGTVIVVRHPAEVAASLAARNGMSTVTAYVLWLRYVLAAVANDDHHLLVNHHELLEHPAEAIRAIAQHFDLAAPDQASISTVVDHVDPSLHHHRAGPASVADVDAANPVVALVDAVWNDGTIQVGALDDPTAEAIRQGWLRPPADTAALDQARARVVDLTELLRRRTRERIEDQYETSVPSDESS